MSMRRSVDSLVSIALKSVCDEFHEYVAKDRDVIESLPFPLKELILRKVTHSAIFSRESDPKQIFSLLLNKNLRTVDLSCVKIDDDLLELFEICTELRDVRFSGSEICYPSASSLCKFLQNKRKLRVLHLAHCRGVTDDVIKVIVASCPDLSELVLRCCRLVTDVSMNCLATMHNLKLLDFSGTLVTDSGIATLSQGNSKDKILELRIAYCSKITFRVLSVVVENCTNMEVFEFHNCSQSPNDCQREVETLEGSKMKRLKQLTFTVTW